MTEVVEVEPLLWPTGEPVDIESIEGYTQDARAAVHPLDDSSILTPDELVRQLADVSRWASRMTTVIKNAEAHKRLSAAEKDEARARAVLEVGQYPAREQSARISLAIAPERRTYDAAVVAFEEARRVGNMLSDHSSRLQSMAKLVRLTYEQDAS